MHMCFNSFRENGQNGNRLFMSALFPVLKTGKTLACFHRSSNIPDEILVLIILHRWRAKTGVAIPIYLQYGHGADGV